MTIPAAPGAMGQSGEVVQVVRLGEVGAPPQRRGAEDGQDERCWGRCRRLGLVLVVRVLANLSGLLWRRQRARRDLEPIRRGCLVLGVGRVG